MFEEPHDPTEDEAASASPPMDEARGPAPDADHYWDKVQKVWRPRSRRNGGPGGPPKKDPVLEAERVETLRVLAQARPPRSRPPSNEMMTMNQDQVLEHVTRAVQGDYLPAPEARAPLPTPKSYQVSEERLRDAGLDEVMFLIAEGWSEREVCARLGVRVPHLKRWLTSIPEGATRAREARMDAAQAWLDRGLAALEDAENLSELAKAREIATMCRRYAAICDPRFSERVQVDTTIKAENPAEIDLKLRLLVAAVTSQKAEKTGE